MQMKLRDRIDKLNKIGIALSSVHDLDELLELVVSEARDLTNADAGSLYLRNEDYLYFKISQNDTLEKRFGSRKDFFKPFDIKISKDNIAGYVATTSEPLNIKDAYSLKFEVDYKHSKEFDKKFKYKTCSILTVPMLDHRGDVIGVLQLINALDEKSNCIPFPEELEDLVLSLASQAAVAINNTRFLSEVKNLFKAVVQYSASAIDARSPHTAGHSERVAELAFRLATIINTKKNGFFVKINFDDAQMEEIRYAGWLHDIGKIGVKELVLDKGNKVSDENLNNIEYRFYTLILQKKLQALEQKLKLLRESKSPQDAEFQKVEEEFNKKKDEIADELKFIKRINVPTERMSEDDIERLKKIPQIFFENPVDKNIIPIIDEQELENLSILRGSLNPKERQEAQSHVVKSITIIEKIPFRGYLKNIPDIVAKHHEYLDGSGYPNGFKADQISMQSRILCVVDIFDALAAKDRPYKPAMPVPKALDILRKDAQAGKLDKDIVELFIEEKIYEGMY